LSVLLSQQGMAIRKARSRSLHQAQKPFPVPNLHPPTTAAIVPPINPSNNQIDCWQADHNEQQCNCKRRWLALNRTVKLTFSSPLDNPSCSPHPVLIGVIALPAQGKYERQGSNALRINSLIIGGPPSPASTFLTSARARRLEHGLFKNDCNPNRNPQFGVTLVEACAGRVG